MRCSSPRKAKLSTSDSNYINFDKSTKRESVEVDMGKYQEGAEGGPAEYKPYET